jgi:hypothetical protein
MYDILYEITINWVHSNVNSPLLLCKITFSLISLLSVLSLIALISRISLISLTYFS